MRRKRQSLIAIIVVVWAAAAQAADWTEPATALARSIAGVTGPTTLSVSMRNGSDLTADEAAEIQRTVQAQLRISGIRPVRPGANGADVTITLSQNVQGYLWIAEIRQGGESKVVMQAVARPATAQAAQAQRAVIRQTALHAQRERILDAAVVETAPGATAIAVLDADEVALYQPGATEPQQKFPITHARPWPRDLRGRLLGAQGHAFDVYLPGVVCSATATQPVAMPCRESDDPWPLGAGQSGFYGAARNFFTGALSPGMGRQTTVAAFYSAAAVPRGNATLWVMAGVDGSVRQFDGTTERMVSAGAEWGGDLAAVNSGCGPMLLVTGNGDGAAADTLRAYEIGDREPVEASAAVELSGPVTALWSAADGAAATAVVRNLKTDNYEAFSVTVSCNQ